MSNVDDTHGYTKEDVAKLMQQESKKHGGNVPANSEAAALQSIIDSASKDKDALIAERQANLPLPDQPPGPGDFNSADGRTVNVGSGGISSDVSAGATGSSSGLRGPATVDSSARTDASQFEGVATAGMEAGRVPGGVPSDAVTADKREAPGVTETRGEDYGYPQKSDPSAGVK